MALGQKEKLSYLKKFPLDRLDLERISTPVYIVNEPSLKENLQILSYLQEQSGAKILLALKAFSQYSLFPLIQKSLSGASASSLFEARLAYEEFSKKEVHICSPAYPPEDFEEILEYTDHVVFNSFHEFRKLNPLIPKSSKNHTVGMRINPEHSEVDVPLYDPCSPESRLGVRKKDFQKISSRDLQGIEGLHFHALCELGAENLQRTLKATQEKFHLELSQVQWCNFGGGHHITKEDYDLDLLLKVINDFQKTYPNIERLYLEPGEAVVLNTGILIASVLDILPSHSGTPTLAILDTSATAHMPDVLEAPYTPHVYSNGSWAQSISDTKKSETKQSYSYVLGGLTCLAGDVIGGYSFLEPLEIGQKLIFWDMAHYTMVKNTNFNGVRSPSIAISNTDTGKIQTIRRFDYEDYKRRLS